MQDLAWTNVHYFRDQYSKDGRKLGAKQAQLLSFQKFAVWPEFKDRLDLPNSACGRVVDSLDDFTHWRQVPFPIAKGHACSNHLKEVCTCHQGLVWRKRFILGSTTLVWPKGVIKGFLTLYRQQRNRNRFRAINWEVWGLSRLGVGHDALPNISYNSLEVGGRGEVHCGTCRKIEKTCVVDSHVILITVPISIFLLSLSALYSFCVLSCGHAISIA